MNMVKPLPEVFVRLDEAVMRSARNFHRLEHLGRISGAPEKFFTFHEESITDLLVGDMAGQEYQVSAPCTSCPPGSGACLDWDGSPVAGRGLKIRALTKIEEGGSRTKRGVHADFILTFENSQDTAAGQVRLLFQAKRVRPGETFLVSKRERGQYESLVAVAAEVGAAPYYVLYVQRPDAHTSSSTNCRAARRAADTAILVVPADLDPARDLRGWATDRVIGQGRRLSCLSGCLCWPKGAGSKDPWDIALDFVRMSFPDYLPGVGEQEILKGIARVSVDEGRVKPARRGKTHLASRESEQGQPEIGQDESVLVIRLGKPRTSNDDRESIGYHTGMSADEIREATRRYWRLDLQKAKLRTHVVATSGTEVVGVYSLVRDSLVAVGSRRHRRVEMELEDVQDSDARTRLGAQAIRAVTRLKRGARTPVLYA